MEEQNKKNWHDKHYKLLLLIPLALLVFSIAYMFVFYSNNGDFIHKDISLTGGTSITIYDKIDVDGLTNSLSSKLDELTTREIFDLVTGEQKAVNIETTTGAEETKKVLEDYLGYELISGENSDIVSTGSSFGESFYKQLLIAVIMAFLFMAIVVFILFKSAIPSGAVIISAFAGIVLTLVTINILGIKVSSAGIIALLMLIGYSVDTDILLTNRVLKRNEGSLNERLFGAFKTGMTMTLTSFFAMLIALLIVKSFSPTLTQIFLVLVIGLLFDIINTWITNVSILKWYILRKK